MEDTTNQKQKNRAEREVNSDKYILVTLRPLLRSERVRFSITVSFTATLVLVSFNVLVLFGIVVEQKLKVSVLVDAIVLNHGCVVVMIRGKKMSGADWERYGSERDKA